MGGEQEQKILEVDFGYVKFEVSGSPHGTAGVWSSKERCQGEFWSHPVSRCEGLREVRVPRERVWRRRKTLEAPTGASQGDEKAQRLKQMGWQMRSVEFQKPRGVVKEGGIHCGLGRDHGFSTTEVMSQVGGGGPDGQMRDGNG